MPMRSKKRDAKLKKLEENCERIASHGRDLQARGVTIAKKGVSGCKQVRFLRTELPKYESMATTYPKLGPYLPADDSWIDRALNETDLIVNALPKASEILAFSTDSTSTALSTVSTLGTIAVSGVMLIGLDYPQTNFFETHGLENPTSFLNLVEDEDLSRLLGEYDSDLETQRRGAWNAFYSASETKLSQAAHTMRDLLRLLISRHASNAEVKKASWWTETAGSKDGVSLTQRLRYLLYGKKETQDPDTVAFIESQVSKFKEDSNLLQAAAHGSKKSEAAVEASMKSVEQLVLLILRRIANDNPG